LHSKRAGGKAQNRQKKGEPEMTINWTNWDEARDAEIGAFSSDIQSAYAAWLPHAGEANENGTSDAYYAGLKEIERLADNEYGSADISWDGDPTNPEGPLFGLRRAAHESASEEGID
jgi:hypothetical protein